MGRAKRIFSAVLIAILCFGAVDASAQTHTIRRRGNNNTEQQQQRRQTTPTKEQQYQKDLKAGEALFDKEQYADAKDHFEKMLSKYPKHDKEINRYIKMCDMILAQQLEEEEEAYRTAFSQGATMMQNGRNADAMAHYRNMLTLYPNHASEISAQITVCEDLIRALHNGHVYVDLGLPSGLKWAACNVGATSPSDFGDYYSWGEVNTKSYFGPDCKTYEKDIRDFSGNAQYDVATAMWGGGWRMPTQAECEELIDNCNWEWTIQEGHEGYKVTSKTNGNSIFFPATEYKIADRIWPYEGTTEGHYWTSTPWTPTPYTSDSSHLLKNVSAYSLKFCHGDFNYITVASTDPRNRGMTVRPVVNLLSK